MKPIQVTTLQDQFDALVRKHPDEPSVEFWFTPTMHQQDREHWI